MLSQRARKRASTATYKRNREQRLVQARGRCELQLPGCTQVATEAHHVIKRSHLVVHEVENLRACCHSCNQWVEEHPNDAKERGFVGHQWPQIEPRDAPL